MKPEIAEISARMWQRGGRVLANQSKALLISFRCIFKKKNKKPFTIFTLYRCFRQRRVPYNSWTTGEAAMTGKPAIYMTWSITALCWATETKDRTIKADTQGGFCSRSMLQGHAAGAKLLRVYQRLHGYTSSSGAEFPPRKMLQDI